MRRPPAIALLALGLLVAVGTAHAAFTTDTCLVQKRQAWGNLRKCEATEQVKQLKKKTSDLTTCQTKFQEKLAKITGKAAQNAVGCRFGDNGDGTVTDYDTGLQWEKKTGTFVINLGYVCLGSGAIHCINDTYDWNGANQFVGASTDGSTLSTCFSGHCDWRLPSVVELQAILLAPNPCNGTTPCIDPIFGPTIGPGPTGGLYWSSTTNGANPLTAWVVDFDTGFVGTSPKGNDETVRAVRQGL